MKVILPHNRWFGKNAIEIQLPDSWKVHVAEMDGDRLPVLTVEEMREKINHPFGAPALRELVRGKQSVCILFDDMSRATPCDELAHIVLDELLSAGIKKENITFLCALGMHGALELDDFEKKLGKDIVREYAVYNHNPFENCIEVGTTSRGFVAEVNAEIMKYDVKIGLGAMVPHPIAGFGGGCKIVLPGICSLKTVQQNHRRVYDQIWLNRERPFVDTFGNLQVCDMREDAEEVAMLVGLDFKIDILMNTSCEVVDLFAGHPIKEFYAGVDRAFDVYRTERFDPVDVCIINANSKANEAFIALNIGMDCLKDGGDIVLVNESPTGIVNHYLSSMWGKHYGSMLTSGNKDRTGLPPKVRKMIILSPHPQYTAAISYGRTDQVLWASNWAEVMHILSDRGSDTTAAVFLDGFVEMFYEPFKKDYLPVNLNLSADKSDKKSPGR